MLRSLPYASFLSYSPRGTTNVSVQSQRICYSVKQDGRLRDGRPAIEALIGRLAGRHREAFADFLGNDVTLVPVPRSAPLPTRGGGPALWVPSRICEALTAEGLGGAVVFCVERIAAVPKSAFAAPGERPSIDRHIESMRAGLDLPTARMTLVDDVVTKGATLFAAATLITRAFPNVEVRAFALIRTCGLVPNVERIIEPTFGTITRDRWGDANREP